MIDGGVGTDTINGAALTNAATITFGSDTAGTFASGTGNSASFQNVEAFVTGVGDDVISAGGTTTGKSFATGAGADTITAGSGNDTIDAGSGDDVVTAGAGDDSVDGGAGNDSIDGGTGNDTLAGGDGADTILGGAGDDVIDGGIGDDQLFGGDGNDSITGGEGNDIIEGGAGADTLVGGLGNDSITFNGGDSVEGDEGDDTFFFDANPDNLGAPINIGGGAGFDRIDLTGLQNYSFANITSQTVGGVISYSGQIIYNYGTGQQQIINFTDVEVICFTPGTMIATPMGPRAIESLVPGDLVITRDSGLQPIRWIGRRTVPAVGRFAPVRIQKGAVPDLATDLIVSPQHRMLIEGYRAQLMFGQDEVLASAKHMVDGKRITRQEGGDVTYVHMIFDRHEIVFANGAATESFHPGNFGLDSLEDACREELFGVFPQLRALPTSYGQTARRVLRAHEVTAIAS